MMGEPQEGEMATSSGEGDVVEHEHEPPVTPEEQDSFLAQFRDKVRITIDWRWWLFMCVCALAVGVVSALFFAFGTSSEKSNQIADLTKVVTGLQDEITTLKTENGQLLLQVSVDRDAQECRFNTVVDVNFAAAREDLAKGNQLTYIGLIASASFRREPVDPAVLDKLDAASVELQAATLALDTAIKTQEAAIEECNRLHDIGRDEAEIPL